MDGIKYSGELMAAKAAGRNKSELNDVNIKQ